MSSALSYVTNDTQIHFQLHISPKEGKFYM